MFQYKIKLSMPVYFQMDLNFFVTNYAYLFSMSGVMASNAETDHGVVASFHLFSNSSNIAFLFLI